MYEKCDWFNKPFGSDELKARSRQYYVNNECGSDEYAETQPQKGTEVIRGVLDDISNIISEWTMNSLPGVTLTHNGLNTTVTFQQFMVEFMDRVVDWYASNPNAGWYDGVEQLKPVLMMAHDFNWSIGCGPYGMSEKELLEMLNE